MAVFVKKISQKDNHHFQIRWNDDREQSFRLSRIQKQCPCANCVDELTGQRKGNPVDEDVRAVQIKSVGRYALRIQFTSGCSLGIYDFEMLRAL